MSTSETTHPVAGPAPGRSGIALARHARPSASRSNRTGSPSAGTSRCSDTARPRTSSRAAPTRSAPPRSPWPSVRSTVPSRSTSSRATVELLSTERMPACRRTCDRRSRRLPLYRVPATESVRVMISSIGTSSPSLASASTSIRLPTATCGPPPRTRSTPASWAARLPWGTRVSATVRPSRSSRCQPSMVVTAGLTSRITPTSSMTTRPDRLPPTTSACRRARSLRC